MSIPNVFISYSHDSEKHKLWVIDLATKMREAGIDATLDEWELEAGDDIAYFMETKLEEADYVIMVCTEKYVSKANAGEGGVGYEKMIITSSYLQHINENKFIPIIRQKGTIDRPTFLKTKLFINLSEDQNFEQSFEKLIRTIHQSPLHEKPTLGENPFKNDWNHIEYKSNAEGAANPLAHFMEIVARNYEKGTTPWVMKKTVRDDSNFSSIQLDMLIKEAVSLRYIEIDRRGDLNITDPGRKYIMDNNLLG